MPASSPRRHPLHPALVHFPIACWSAVPVTDALYLWLRTPTWWWLSFWLIAVGCAIALPAMAIGLLDLRGVSARYPAGTHPAHATARRHLLLMGSAWSVFVFDLLLRSPEALPTTAIAWIGLALSAAGFATLLLGAYAGAELVYRHGIGQVDAGGDAKSRPGPQAGPQRM